MTRTERNDFNYIKRATKGQGLTYAELFLRTDYSPEYKNAVHEYFLSIGFKPFGMISGEKDFEGIEKVIYINWAHHTNTWEELTTSEERKRYAEALN